MKTISFICLLLLFTSMIHAQNEGINLPYQAIPEYPDAYTEGTVAARVVDALGFRYYWATEGLTEENLAFRPSEDARSMGETLDHLYGLSETIANAPQAKPNIRPADWSGMSWEEKRRKTLENIQQASELLKAGKEGDMEDYKVIFQRGENSSEFPFWNMLNGPIADAIYHTGQIVSFRRSAGNPIPSGVNVFMGTKK